MSDKKLQFYINGAFEDGTDFDEVLDPSTNKVLSLVPRATQAQVDRAIAAAKAAQDEWEALPAIERAGYLKKIANKIREKAHVFIELIKTEGGKVQGLAETEVYFTADYLDYMAEWARRYEGEIIQSDRPNENIFLFKRAIGVTTGILPWNFPFFLIARKMAPALVTGNTIVVKPSTLTPENAYEFAKLVDEVGLPKGVFNLVTGGGATVGNRLASHPDVGMVSITGSVSAGQKVMEAAAENITKVSLELGGKAPAIVMPDADLDLAAKAIVDSRVINTGQVCNCAERVYVHADIQEVFIQKLVNLMSAVKYGNTSEISDLHMGPLIDAKSVDSVEAKVKKAQEQGGRVVLGGKRVAGEGNFFEPTVIVDVTNEMAIIQEEVFGPVLPIVVFTSLEEVIGLANDSEFGLTSSVYTSNLNTAFKVVRGLKFGETYINRENFEAMQGFHAGFRKSGIGGADGKHGLEEYLQTQVVYLETN
ncbi:aldehyde dehydrogenase [Brochothrix campestris]|uniref:Aldehyde dehydrogenase n=1 Tax=Brochothrix campestris FSL F6-1037 TaxID=1265861 RepID=W7CQ60_9LIST|nr:aldehyde dehydrogenase [Brochothrix campestris]EUJ39227.1 aldehyde dehydrogenase [Brochothrix campestris FSL F6-1037]